MEYFVHEPCASIVIVNWNYGRFVADAIQSVKDQSYQNFQCIVVDNGSTDDSADRIVDAIASHPQFAFHRLPENLGHLGGAVWALQHATGEFVAFVDADDVLAPTYLASHLQAHLAAASAVGFTSSNCLDMNAAGAALTGGNYYMYYSWQQAGPALRPGERTMRLRAVDDAAYAALAQASRHLPAHHTSWFWCPGSSNMFRRALLNVLRPAMPPQALFGGVDGFFTPIVHALTGTILIDQPLSVYRLHGGNDFSAFPSLPGVRNANANSEAQSFASFLRVMIWLVDHVDDVLAIAPVYSYWPILTTVATTYPRPDVFSHPELKAALTRQYPRLIKLFGKTHVFLQLRQRMSFRDYVDVVRGANEHKSPAVVYGRAAVRELNRGFRRLAGKKV